MLPFGPFFARMLASSLVVLAPLVALHAYTLHEQAARAEARAYRTVTLQAQQKGKEVKDFLDRAESLLKVLSARSDLATLDPQRCLDVLGGMATVDPLYANLGVAAVDGTVVCTANPTRGDSSKVRMAGLPGFDAALKSQGTFLGKPVTGPLANVPVAFLGAPLRDLQGGVVGVVAISVHLGRLGERLFGAGLPPGSSLTLVGGESTVYARFPEPQRWVGQATPRSVQNLRRESPNGVVVGEGPDGVTRAYATEPIGVHGLRVAAGIPIDVIFAAPREAQRQSYLVAGATLLLAAALTFLLARALGRPVRSLTRTAKAWAAGDIRQRADERLPGEFQTLAREFNAMIDAREAGARRLVESERWYAAMLDGADLIALHVHQDGSLHAGNDALWRLTGWSAETLSGPDWAQRLFPADQLPAFEAMRRSLASDGSVTSRHETDIVRRDGQRLRIRWASAALRRADGAHDGMSSIGEDITGRHEADQARQEMARADAANQAKTEFLAHMSHELRTPLNAVLGFSQLLQMESGNRLDATQRQHLDLIHLGGVQLRALIDDVLDVSQIESGRLSINLTDVDPAAVIDEVLRLSGPNAAAQHITLAAERPSHGPVTLRTDAVRLRQVLLNLVSNGIKYNRPGGHVTIGTHHDGDALCLTVTDDGLGMTPDQLSRLFEPFNRLGREHGTVAGTGIGMSLSRQLARLLGGELHVDSSPTQGTRVTLTVKASLVTVSGEPTQPADLTPPEGGPRGTVLYIEDNAANTLIVRELLAPWKGVRLLLAQDGRSGIDMARASRPDLVLLDMRLPDLHGIEVLAELRTDTTLRQVPIVALSASAMPEEVDAARAAGATAYWTKPIEFGPFLAGVTGLLAGR